MTASTRMGYTVNDVRQASGLESMVFNMTFLCLLLAMGMLVTSGFTFFYGARYDFKAYSGTASISVFVAIFTVTCSSFSLSCANYVKTAPLTVFMFMASALAAQDEYYMFRILGMGIKCADLPVELTYIGGDLNFGYGGENSTIWHPTSSASEEDYVLSSVCPVALDTFDISTCRCCGTVGGGDSTVFAVLHSAVLGVTASGSQDHSIGACLCFNANNFQCSDLRLESGGIETSTFYILTLGELREVGRWGMVSHFSHYVNIFPLSHSHTLHKHVHGPLIRSDHALLRQRCPHGRHKLF